MRNTIIAILIGLTSSFAFADSFPENDRRDTLSYECKFEGWPTCATCGDKKVQCRVEGQLCNEGAGLQDYRRCRGNEDPLQIKCSDGFSLRVRDSAVEIDNGSLWINAEEFHRIATIFVEDFARDMSTFDDSRRDFDRFAELIYSEQEGEANRLEGKCEFRRGGRI